MKFLSKLFDKKSEEPEKPHRWELTPFEARHRANLIVKSAAALDVVLDYSPESLKSVDLLIDKERETGLGLTPEMAHEMISLGAYVGEVMVRHLDGKWAYGTMLEKHDPLVMIINGRYVINVVSVVFKRFTSGEPNSVVSMFEETRKLAE
ncbi:MAG: DUF6278 family protein [Armatimonadota bacterium]